MAGPAGGWMRSTNSIFSPTEKSILGCNCRIRQQGQTLDQSLDQFITHEKGLLKVYLDHCQTKKDNCLFRPTVCE
jgi:hypothetical protein